MGKAGGIIGLFAGVFGVGAAVITLFFGGIGGALNLEDAETVIGLGWGGVFFSCLVIVFGAIAIFKHTMGGYGLIITSILGAILGGTLVAICMVLSLIGGILSVIAGRKKTTKTSIDEGGQIVEDLGQQKKKSPMKWIAIASVALIVVIVAIFGTSTEKSVKRQDPLAELVSAQPSNLVPYGELADIFTFGSKYTDLQRENKLKEIKGKVVQWTLPVYEVRSLGGNKYRIITQESSSIFDYFISKKVSTSITLTARTEEDKRKIESLKTNDNITFKGVIAGSTFRSLDINPAILVSERKTDLQPPLKQTAPVN